MTDVLGEQRIQEPVALRIEGTQSEILQPDFFAGNLNGPFDQVYERAFLCSLAKTAS